MLNETDVLKGEEDAVLVESRRDWWPLRPIETDTKLKSVGDALRVIDI